MNELANVDHSYSTELLRKAIHLCSLSIPVIYYFIPKSTALTILLPLTAAFLLTDVARFLHRPTGKLFHSLFGWLLRARERKQDAKRLTGATYVLLSATICVWLFPKLITVTAFTILIISDTSAALIGRKFGKQEFLKKTREGAIAFLVSALIVVAFTPKVAYLPLEYVIGGIAALIGTVAESFSTIIDDNLSIPLSIGLSLWLMYIVFLPHLNVYALDIHG